MTFSGDRALSGLDRLQNSEALLGPVLGATAYYRWTIVSRYMLLSSGMIWGVRIAIFTEIRHLVKELITFLSIFGPQKSGILTARLNKSLSISSSIQWEGISVMKHAQSLHSFCENNSFWKNLWWDMWAMMHASKVSWIGITFFYCLW